MTLGSGSKVRNFCQNHDLEKGYERKGKQLLHCIFTHFPGDLVNLGVLVNF